MELKGAAFPTTRWSVVLAAGQDETPERELALAELCQLYWPPVYTYIRRRGNSQHDAEELTQEFFARLLEKRFLKDLSPEGARFRSFLLVCVKRFLANEHDRSTAKKRGGDHRRVEFDFEAAECRCRGFVADHASPERLFERRWAMTLLEHVLGRLAQEWNAAGNAELFQQLKVFLAAQHTAPSYAEIAESCGMTSGAVGVAVHRLRKRYGELLRSEIAATLTDGENVEDEIRSLFAAVGG